LKEVKGERPAHFYHKLYLIGGFCRKVCRVECLGGKKKDDTIFGGRRRSAAREKTVVLATSKKWLLQQG